MAQVLFVRFKRVTSSVENYQSIYIYIYILQRFRRSYIVVMQKQKLHSFCNRSSPDDGPKSGRNYLGYIHLWKIHQSIPTEYDKSNTAIRLDSTRKYVDRIMFNEICINEEMLAKIYIHIYIYIYIYISLETVVEVDPKATFSIATTPRCRGGRILLSLNRSTYP